MGKRLWLVFLSCLLAFGAFAGCGQKADTEEEPLYGEDTEAGFRRTVLYYGTEDGFVVPVMKRIPWEEGIGKAALGYLVDDDANRAAAAPMGLKALVPEGTSFSLRIGDTGEASLDITGLTELADAEAERNMVTAIVNTLTEFDSIDTVRITLDGAQAATLPHGTDISTAMASQPLNVEEGEVAVSTGSAHPLTLYYPNTSASLNVPVTRYMEAEPTFSTAMTALLEGSDEEALASFPDGTELLSAYIADGVACVDLSSDFRQVAEVDGLCNCLLYTSRCV